jgi:cell division protein FtsW
MMKGMDQLFNSHLKGDRTIWMVALVLGVVSLLAVYSASSWMGWRHDGGTFRILVKHGMMLAAGGGIMYTASKLRFTVYSKLAQLLLGATAALLLLTLLVGTNVNGASRWLAVPGLGITFQTSDLARVVILVYLARVLGRHREEPWTFREVLLKLVLPVGAICGLILPANFSTAALLFLTCMVLLFIGEVPLKHLLTLAAMAVAAFGLLLLLSKTAPDLLPRLKTWESRLTHHGGEDRDANYQVNNAKIAIVHGGLLPNGPGTGTSRNFMPHPESDMIYAFIIEEYGSIIGGLGLLLLYLVLLFRAMRIAQHCGRTLRRAGGHRPGLGAGAASPGEHGRGREPGARDRATPAVGEHGRHQHVVHLPLLGHHPQREPRPGRTTGEETTAVKRPSTAKPLPRCPKRAA